MVNKILEFSDAKVNFGKMLVEENQVKHEKRASLLYFYFDYLRIPGYCYGDKRIYTEVNYVQ